MSWDYRIVKKRCEKTGGEVYAIHDCFFDEEDRIWACTKEPITPIGESPEGLRDDLLMMVGALTSLSPIVDYDLIPEPDAIDPIAEAREEIESGEATCISLEEVMDKWLGERDDSVTCSTCYHWDGKGKKKAGICKARPVGVRDRDFETAKRYAYTKPRDWCARWKGEA